MQLGDCRHQRETQARPGKFARLVQPHAAAQHYFALVGGNGAAYGCRQQPPRFIAAAAAQNAIGDGARLEFLEAPSP